MCPTPKSNFLGNAPCNGDNSGYILWAHRTAIGTSKPNRWGMRLLSNAKKQVSTLTKRKIKLAPKTVGTVRENAFLLTCVGEKRLLITTPYTFLYALITLIYIISSSIYIYNVSKDSNSNREIDNQIVARLTKIAKHGFWKLANRI